MKVAILAGGFGTRISEMTNVIPKPMVRVGDVPIIHHIMNIYSSYGHTDFVLALGYKSDIIKEYFLSLWNSSGSFTLDLEDGSIMRHSRTLPNWKITFVETGQNSMTGGRLLRLKNYLEHDTFMLTYGDGLSNVNLDALVSHHKSANGKMTVTAVRPLARFGELIIESGKVKSFMEKPQLATGYINGGYFVCEPSVFDYLVDDSTILEGHPLETLARESNLSSFMHNGFWQCMDTKRDHDYLNKLAKESNILPWMSH